MNMQFLDNYPTTEDMSGAWCNSSVVTSSIMEAVSMVTPVLENFFIRTVAEALKEERETELGQRCHEFIREESNHSRIHKKFNQALIRYLGKTPPGLAMIEALLDGTRRHLSLSSRLLLAAALEHMAAVLSKVYVKQEGSMHIESAFARELFVLHAREELAHCSVVFDLWRSKDATGRLGRSLTILVILLAGAFYVTAAVPWILYRKSGKRLGVTLSALAGFTAGSRADIRAYSPLSEMFAFVRRDYHPDKLFADSLAETLR